jgi:hypothetical protein
MSEVRKGKERRTRMQVHEGAKEASASLLQGRLEW